MKRDFQLASTYNSFLALEEANKIANGGLMCFEASSKNVLERIFKPHCDYQIFSTLANGTDLNRQKYTKSLVNTYSFYKDFTNTHFQNIPIPHLTRTLCCKLIRSFSFL